MPDANKIREQLLELALTVSGQLDIFFGSNDEAADQQLGGLAEMLTRQLLAEDEELAVDAAHRIRALIPEPSPWWWNTDLGQAVAQVEGFGAETVPRVHAAAILGVSRQRIHQWEQDGSLASTADGVDNDSLVELLRYRMRAGRHRA